MDDMQAHKLEKFTRSVNMEVGEHINKIVEAAKDQSEKLSLIHISEPTRP